MKSETAKVCCKPGAGSRNVPCVFWEFWPQPVKQGKKTWAQEFWVLPVPNSSWNGALWWVFGSLWSCTAMGSEGCREALTWVLTLQQLWEGTQETWAQLQLCHKALGDPELGSQAWPAGCRWELWAGGGWMDKGSTAASCHPSTKSDCDSQLGCTGTGLQLFFLSCLELLTSKSTQSCLCTQERAGAGLTSGWRCHPGNPRLFMLSLTAYLRNSHSWSDLLGYLV